MFRFNNSDLILLLEVRCTDQKHHPLFGSLFERQTLRSHPRPIKSEFMISPIDMFTSESSRNTVL